MKPKGQKTVKKKKKTLTNMDLWWMKSFLAGSRPLQWLGCGVARSALWGLSTVTVVAFLGTRGVVVNSFCFEQQSVKRWQLFMMDAPFNQPNQQHSP